MLGFQLPRLGYAQPRFPRNTDGAKLDRDSLHTRPSKVLTEFLEAKFRRYQIGQEIAFLNVPPAVARHLRFK